MGWKLLFLGGILALGLHLAGYSVSDIRDGATSLGNANAAGISPRGESRSDWGNGS